MTLPRAFVDQIASYGAACMDGLCEVLESGAPDVSVRINRRKGAALPDDAVRVSWCDEGFYLADRPSFTFDPAFHQGRYYVQDASSMVIARLVGDLVSKMGGRPLRCLDACAAPGGKTTAALSALPDGSLLVANEFDFRRAAILAENIAKWGDQSVMVVRGDTARFGQLAGAFDLIMADVPCSGEGMMRKDSEAVAQWSPSLVADCAVRQREIVANLWDALHPGGFLIYSTCTFNRQENEDVVEYICGELGGETIDTGLAGCYGIAPAITGNRDCLRFIPGQLRGEGLFVSVIRKDGDKAAADIRIPKKARPVLSKVPAGAMTVSDWMVGDSELVALGDTVMALPALNARWMKSAASLLDVVSAGVTVATIKGRDVIPAQGLALSTSLRDGAFPVSEADYRDAISYLRRESVIPGNAPRGFVLLTWQGRPLGFVKNLGNRANNLYPVSWRIISQTVPDARPIVIP